MGNKILIVILASFLTASCSIHQKKYKIKDVKQGTEKQAVNIKSLDDDRKSTQFECNSIYYTIQDEKINRAYFNVELRRCLLETGFNGNEKSNMQIAQIIEEVRQDGLLIFGRDPKFRGSIVFEKLLSISDNHKVTPDGVRTYAFAMASYYIDMIENIDGMDVESYVVSTLNIPHYDYILLLLDLEKYSPIYYEAILKAWKEGKIVLKAFGEK